MYLEPIPNFIQIIPGFLQNRAQSNQGLPIIGQEFIHRFNFPGLAQVELDEWNSDWNVQAEWIYRLGIGGTPKVMIVAYSWGAGFGFTRLAQALADRGVEIEHAILSDPVYHWGDRWMHGFRIPFTNSYLGLAQLKAYYPYSRCTRQLSEIGLLPPRPKIKVPPNVKHVDYFIQKNSPLCGHELIATDESTVIQRYDVKFRTHTNMDDCPEFWARCREIAATLFQPPAKPKRTSHSKPNI